MNVGDQIPPLALEITATRIVAGAIASRDFMPVHHDRAFAQDAGAKDVFMNILTTNGYVARYVTDWAGPEARLKRLSTRLGVPNYPGDTMTLTGTVTAIDDGAVTVEIRGANSLGDHVTGTVTFAT